MALIHKAEKMYVKEMLSCKKVAERITDVTEGTIKDWSSKFHWTRKRQNHLRRTEEMEGLLHRLEVRLAHMAMQEEVDPKQVYALARIAAVLKPPAAVVLRKMDKEETEEKTEDTPEKVQKRMDRVMEILRGAGFKDQTAHRQKQSSPPAIEENAKIS